ncbi:GNAT family N-acetyltransferase [Sporichthya polymorpha]|uniref:GNAT family N-acetyltransferase n=1 Tax=Sporichthya polymorpha TaxID=35751 RepID=UPI00036D7771|nr:GNAT family N-acetyltransferase [Sporichthya polymorpha]
MHIERLDPARVDDVVAVLAAAHAHDLPDDPPFAPGYEGRRILHPTPDEPTTHWVAVDGPSGRIVGLVQLTTPELDNTSTGIVDLTVHPEFRRRGVGRLLWDSVADLALASERKLLIFEARMDSVGEAFARSLGAELGLYDARRRLLVDKDVRARAVDLETSSRPHATGYAVHSFVGAAPERFAAGLAYLNGRMSTDAPMENLQWEPEVYDVERLRGREEAAQQQGLEVYTTVAVDEEGTVAAFTHIGLAPEIPEHGWQWNTIVDPDHRGHRLGTWVKVANLAHLLRRRPEVRTLLTWNAASNTHMIAVNEAMGFRLWDHWGEWQVRL